MSGKRCNFCIGEPGNVVRAHFINANPAAWNGIYGLRPSQGRVPAWPERDVYLAHMSTEGAMGRTVLDIAMLLGVQAGHDPRSPLSLQGRLDEFDTVTSATTVLNSEPRGTRIGWLGDLGGHLAFEPGILEKCESGLRQALHPSSDPR